MAETINKAEIMANAQLVPDLSPPPTEEKTVDESIPPPAPEPQFTRYGFNALPGVALIVPDQTPPAELIRIAATVVEEISLMVLRKTAAALLE